MSRTCRLKTVQEKGLDYIYNLVFQNLIDIEKILEWNYNNNIFVFRLSSEIFPFATHIDYCDIFNFKQFEEQLRKIGNLANKYNQRLTFHPGHFT
jgi:UV DNA damage endonuclease